MQQTNDHSNGDSNTFIQNLSKGPFRYVTTYPRYFINGYKFHTIGHGSSKETMNSGVCIKGSNYSADESDYYGQLSEVVELEYPGLENNRIVLFKCEWFDPTRNVGTKIHSDYKLVDVNHKRRFNRYEPFIMAVQATQVYYCTYPSLSRDKSDWWAICKIKARSNIEVPTSQLNSANLAIAPAFQEDDINNIEHMHVDEDPKNLCDSNGGLIEIEDDHVQSEDELELPSESDEMSEDPLEDDSDTDN